MSLVNNRINLQYNYKTNKKQNCRHNYRQKLKLKRNDSFSNFEIKINYEYDFNHKDFKKNLNFKDI